MFNNNTVSRHRASTAKHNSFLSSTQSDRARLIYSAAFRRLQQKAQVFSLESNSSVRSRLTHSIEVSHIGRYIIACVCEKIESSELSYGIKQYWVKNSLALSNIVETACLMHDIGNPPFGHFGEAAISHWANSNETKDSLQTALGTKDCDCGVLDDFKNFDGNPQGFRIITKLQGDDGFYGLNLTYSQLTAFLKYTHSPKTKNKNLPFSKKIGFFSTEEDVIYSAWESLNMPMHSRHPLGFLMEASDDISYCISDIEDGIEKNIIRISHFQEHVTEGLKSVIKDNGDSEICQNLINCLREKEGDPIGVFLSFKTHLSNYLVDNVAQKFVNNYQSIIDFKEHKEMISKDTLEYKILNVLKVYTGNYLFTSHEAECMELSGFAIISGILDEFQRLLKLNKNDFLSLLLNNYEDIKKANLHIHRRLFNRLPEKHLNAYKAVIFGKSIPEVSLEIKNQNLNKKSHFKERYLELDDLQEWNLRAHLVIDFVSGMTDQFSMEFFQMLKGINVKF